MDSYTVKEIIADGYERFVLLERIDNKTIITVHFIEYGEYLEGGDISKKKKGGDVLTGEILISLVTSSKIVVDKDLYYCQNIDNSSHIEAVVEVTKIIDDYSFYAYSNIADREIIIEFEEKTNYKKEDKVWVVGSLELAEIRMIAM